MTPVQIVLGLVLATNAALGAAVYSANRRRAQNQQFLCFSLAVAGWAWTVIGIIGAADERRAALLIRVASLLGLAVVITYHLICIAIDDPGLPPRRRLWKARPAWLAALPMAALCFTPFFMDGVVMPGPDHPLGVPRAVYRPGFFLYVSYFPLAMGAIVGYYATRLRAASGTRRVEFQYALLGAILSVPVALLIHLLAILLGNANQQYGPLSIIPMNMMIAYGIATRRILGVAEVFRRATAYGLMVLYLSAVFLSVLAAARVAGRAWPAMPDALPYLAAALAVAFGAAPARGHLQRVADRLFIGRGAMDVAGTVRQANQILQSIHTTGELLRRFAELVSASTRAGGAAIYLREKDGFTRHWPPAAGDDAHGPETIPAGHPLVHLLQVRQEPFAADGLERFAPSPPLLQAARSLDEFGARLALGIYATGELRGLVTVAPKRSDAIFEKTEQDTLQLLCNQLAAALENARLYTALQDEKRYSENLVESLVSGVVAANRDGLVTVMNREAQRLTGLARDSAVGHPLDVLPPPLRETLRDALSGAGGLRDREAELSGPNTPAVPVRLAATYLRGGDGEVLGALLVFNDLTAIKRLEEQVRRTDRLASVGTLAAGMAHEIKNPLVTIKTFSQLLPERYDDPDFRNTYAALLDEEVRRIDALVNQLLNFTRPLKPALAPVNLHEILEKTLRMVRQPLQQRGCTARLELTAGRDRIRGDAEQLVQAFLNFTLNAIEAMDAGGELSVRTEAAEQFDPNRDPWGAPVRIPCIRVIVGDTGTGIDPAHRARIFDPFFTTKSNGTGLGLSVVHGILTEHGSRIDVEDRPGGGTNFVVLFPLFTEEDKPC